MKKAFFAFCILGLLSCNDKDKLLNNQLTGSWQLIEILNDPGDGSGQFFKIKSQKWITFKRNGEIYSNGSICDNRIEVGTGSSGTYSLSDSTFTSENCGQPNQKYKFSKDGNTLIIIYPCIEPCLAKYRKLYSVKGN